MCQLSGLTLYSITGLNENTGESVSQSVVRIQMMSHQKSQKGWHIIGPSQYGQNIFLNKIISVRQLFHLGLIEAYTGVISVKKPENEIEPIDGQLIDEASDDLAKVRV